MDRAVLPPKELEEVCVHGEQGVGTAGELAKSWVCLHTAFSICQVLTWAMSAGLQNSHDRNTLGHVLHGSHPQCMGPEHMGGGFFIPVFSPLAVQPDPAGHGDHLQHS